jgi:hypothetical protein
LKAVENGEGEIKVKGRRMEGVEKYKSKIHPQWAYVETPL